MKKTYLLIIFIFALLCSCGKPKEIPKLLPTNVISLEEAQTVIGDSYKLQMKNNAVVEDSNSISVKYLSNPAGAGDPVFIELFTDEDNYSKFKKSSDMRTDSIVVQGLGSQAYISYPALHIYSNDCYVKITAGSGSSDEQAELLVELGKLAARNIKAFYEENRQS